MIDQLSRLTLLTDDEVTGNAPPPPATPRAVMMSIAAIAKRDGVAKPGISRTVKRLAADHGLTVERDGQGRVAAVNVAEYDHLRHRLGDPSKAQAPRSRQVTPPPDAAAAVPAGETYNDALRTKTWVEVERSRLALGEAKKELIRVAAVVEAIGECGIAIARIIDRLPNAADDLAVAIGRDGAHGARTALKQMARKMRADVAEAMAAIAGATSELEQETPADADAAP